MPATTIESALAANLAAIEARDAELAKRLREVEPRADVTLLDTPQGVPAVMLGGRQLCSRHRPLDEADAMADKVGLVEHAVVVVLGFGAGWHVRSLAKRLGKNGVIIVFEPDLALLRAVLEQVDHAAWMRESIVVWATDPADRGALGGMLSGMEPILGMGVEIVEHAPSRARLGADAEAFTRLLSECMAGVRTSLATTLVRSVDTARNLVLNLDHYAAGPGVADLAGAAAGFPAVLVAAGPSLQKNIQQLARPGVRDRCVIIAVQTALKPLLAAGVRPHFVTALDYHEISRRFYEGLEAGPLDGVTLVCEPKVHPAVPDAFPNAANVRCCASDFLDQLLGPLRREMGALRAGATVAHLSLYLARHLGCDPIIMIGQDLGFTDGLYYTPGTAVHDDVWAPELNPFNTIAMMEWQRIVRQRLHLCKLPDADGRPVYSDGQMTAYLQQFEADFLECRREGVTVIDATEGGVAKQHVAAMTLANALHEHAARPLPPLPSPPARVTTRLEAVRRRVGELRRDLVALRAVSIRTAALIDTMLKDQRDARKMERHFKTLAGYRAEVDRLRQAFELLDYLNQLGVFKRIKADRRLRMTSVTNEMERQRLELERDIENVRWIADASQELIAHFEQCERLLVGEQADAARETRSARRATSKRRAGSASISKANASRIAALVPVDSERNAMGVPRSLAAPFRGRPVIQATLERLGESRTLDRIVLIAPVSVDVEPLIERSRIGLPVEIERCEGSPFGPEREAIAAARLWADTCWRGGVGGMSVYDEVLCPGVMAEAMAKHDLTAAVLVAPDWPLVDVTSDTGCDALVRRHRVQPDKQRLVFTQAPPGLCGCLVSRPLMEELTLRNRLSTIGGLLVYQPHAPQSDPVGLEANVQIDGGVRRSLVRATFDAERWRSLIENVDPGAPTVEIVRAIEATHAQVESAAPQHVVLELCTDRRGVGLAMRGYERVRREPVEMSLIERVLEGLAGTDDAVLTLDGAGDPLLHPRFDEVIRRALGAGIRAVHVRTELDVDRETLDRLLASGAQVVSVDLHADRAATYERMLGRDRFRPVLENIEHLIENRRRLTDHPGAAALALPWIVPRLQRRAETYEDIEPFFDRWQHILGAAVIEECSGTGVSPVRTPDMDPTPESTGEAPALRGAPNPQRVIERELARRMMVLCDGSVPIDERDLAGRDCAGSLANDSLSNVWRRLLSSRADAQRRKVGGLGTFRP